MRWRCSQVGQQAVQERLGLREVGQGADGFPFCAQHAGLYRHARQRPRRYLGRCPHLHVSRITERYDVPLRGAAICSPIGRFLHRPSRFGWTRRWHQRQRPVDKASVTTPAAARIGPLLRRNMRARGVPRKVKRTRPRRAPQIPNGIRRRRPFRGSRLAVLHCGHSTCQIDPASDGPIEQRDRLAREPT